MKIAILGGGLSGVTLAYLLQHRKDITQISILEGEKRLGGLCRSYKFAGLTYDLGPHILFSKDQKVLGFIQDLLRGNLSSFKRNNQIYLNGKFVKYPFENNLSSLSNKDKKYCLNTFLDNPYSESTAKNLLQFFLYTFGEGITNLYLKPYNEKIWKYPPQKMSIEMIGRLPNPPREDIIKSVSGIPTEGYLHQLHFYYPKLGGIYSLVDAFIEQFSSKVNIELNYPILDIQKDKRAWRINGKNKYDLIISTIPLPSLERAINFSCPKTTQPIRRLKHNSLLVVALSVKKHILRDYFAVMVPDEKICFHRISNLNFLSSSKESVLLVEITYHRGDFLSLQTDETIAEMVSQDLVLTGFISSVDQVIKAEVRRVGWAYPIYDLSHAKNMRRIHEFYEEELGIVLCGRFGEHEYLNMDMVIDNCQRKVENI